MKRYFSISFTLFIFSALNVLTYFLLGIIYGNTSFSEIFSITYPLQFVVALLLSIFSSASNIRANKEGSSDYSISGLILGTIVATAVFAVVAVFAKQYLVFMNIDSKVYFYFTLMAMGELYFGFIISAVSDKLYFENKDKLANICTIGMIILNLLSVVITTLITKNQIIILAVNLCLLLIYSTVWWVLSLKKFRFKFSLIKNFKYESMYIVGDIFMFIIYLFGFKQIFSFGAEYIVALNFTTLITDPQWDALNAAKKIAKIELSQSNYNYKKALKYTAIITAFYIGTILVMYFSLFKLYNVILKIGLVYIGLQILDFVSNIIECNIHTFIQLEHSALKSTVINLFGKALRTFLTLVIISPFTTDIAQLSSGITVVLICEVTRLKYYKLDKTGRLVLKTKFINNLKINSKNETTKS